jgi:hypothetical protein
VDTLVKADIFFFITSLAVILFTAVFLYLFYKIRKVIKRAELLAGLLERNVEEASNELNILIGDIRESMLYRSLFRRRRKKNPVISNK